MNWVCVVCRCGTIEQFNIEWYLVMLGVLMYNCLFTSFRAKVKGMTYLLSYLPLLEIRLVYLVHFVIAWILVWHSVECCEHMMYHLHKVKLCIGRTENFALFLRFWFWFNVIDDFQIFEVKWVGVAQFESFLLWNGTTVCSLHFVLKGYVVNHCLLSYVFRLLYQ